MFKTFSILSVMLLAAALLACDSGSADKKPEKEEENTEINATQHSRDSEGSYTGDPVLLRYKFVQGEEVEYSSEMNFILEVYPQGKMNVDMSYNGKYITDTVYPDKSARVIVRILRMKSVARATGAQDIFYDTDNPDQSHPIINEVMKLVDQPVSVEVTPTGEISRMYLGPMTDSKAFTYQQLQSLINGLFQQISPDPVRVGDVYKVGRLSIIQNLFTEFQTLEYDGSYRITDISSDGKSVILEPLLDSYRDVDEEIKEISLSGELFFDVERGNIRELTGTMDMRVFADGQNMDMKIQMKFQSFY